MVFHEGGVSCWQQRLCKPGWLSLMIATFSVMLFSGFGLDAQGHATVLCHPSSLPQINLRRFEAAIPFSETSIAWFGKVSLTQNYADIRAAYNPQELYVHLTIFDRSLWYDPAPTRSSLTQWDAVTLLLNTSNSDKFSASTWRFVAQLYGEPSSLRTAADRWIAGAWRPVSVPFQAIPGWRGNALNDDSENDRGWAMEFSIPFASLGLPSEPEVGSVWRMAVILHDRDSLAGPPEPDQAWPLSASPATGSCWGLLHFGLPSFSPPGPPTGTVVIRRPTSTSPLVPDADVGGTAANQCPGDENHIWNVWGNLNWGHSTDFNVQNQSDVADWPCFSKYYVTFPLTDVPAGSTIVSATLTLHQFGNAGGPGQAQPSWMQVLTAAQGWDENTITWNNAPLAFENVGGAWVQPLTTWPGWPGVPRSWDVSAAAARAWNRGEPLRLIIYSADSDYHSGKFFVASDTGDWNVEGRPRLEVSWGVDNVSPRVTSVTRLLPLAPVVTSGETVTFRVTFSEPVTGVALDDFTLTLLSQPGSNGTLLNLSQVGAAEFDVTVDISGVRNAWDKHNGVIRLDLPATATFQDAAGNTATALPFTDGQIYWILQQQTFADVPTDHWAWSFIEQLFLSDLTRGCGNGLYCPNSHVSRAQMAVFLQKGRKGANHQPPPASGTVFADVPTTHWAASWIEELYADGITGGCGSNPLRYCPANPVTRAQMAVFLIRSKYGPGYVPPASEGLFADVPPSHWAARWIEQLARDGISSGCGHNLFCPDGLVTRAQMAVFLVKTFNLPVTNGLPPVAATAEWHQHAHDAQRTSYTDQVVPPPWRWLWAWNGPNAGGGIAKVTTSGTLPRNVQPVTGAGKVYVAAGLDGVFALNEVKGQVVWQQNTIGDVRSTVAFDPGTQSVFALSTNGTLYKLRPSDGAVIGQFVSGQTSSLPLPPAVVGDRIVFSMGTSVYAVHSGSLQSLWVYNAGATVAVPPAYSASRDAVVVASEPDLYVHAIRAGDGTQLWRVRPVQPTQEFSDPTEYRLGWPVIADSTGVVLIKVRLPWSVLWRDWPQTNPEMRQLLTQNPHEQALFVLDLDDGSVPYIANVGHGGYGDTDYLPMGPQPVVKRLPNGKEIVYTVIRAKHAYDSRWDSHFGEMVLDHTTVPGLQGGDVRFIAFDWPPGSADPFLLTDEQPNVSMAGDYLFGGHWEAGFALQILDRSPARGTFADKITSQRLASVATSQDDTAACQFSASHYCSSGLFNTRPYDFGFYIYYGQGAVYDQYWSEYATWVVSNGRLYFRSADGAIVALGAGSPSAAELAAATPSPPPPPPDAAPVTSIPVEQARAWSGRTVTVRGRIAYVVENGKHVLIAFARPHQGSFKAIIKRQEWNNFPAHPRELYRPGSLVEITGPINWYQGDPVIFVAAPENVRLFASAGSREREAF